MIGVAHGPGPTNGMTAESEADRVLKRIAIVEMNAKSMTSANEVGQDYAPIGAMNGENLVATVNLYGPKDESEAGLVRNPKSKNVHARQPILRRKNEADHHLPGRSGRKGAAREQDWIAGLEAVRVRGLSAGKGVVLATEADAGKEVALVVALIGLTLTDLIETDVSPTVESQSAGTAVGRLAEQEVETMTEIALESGIGIEIEIERVGHAHDQRLQDRLPIWTRTRWRPGSKRKSKSESGKLRPISLLSAKPGRRACLSLV